LILFHVEQRFQAAVYIFSHNGALIAAIVVILLLVLFLVAVALRRWYKRKPRKEEQALDKEVTLINMKTKSQHGVGENATR